MDNNRKVRLICGVLIVGGFFLPWLDLGEMGELMSGLASAGGGEMSATFSGYELAAGGAGMPGDYASPTLYAIPLLGILVALVNSSNSRGILIILPILAIGVMLLFAPAPNSTGGDAGMTGWAFGKILSLVGLIAIMFNGVSLYLFEPGESTNSSNTQAATSKEFYE